MQSERHCTHDSSGSQSPVEAHASGLVGSRVDKCDIGALVQGGLLGSSCPFGLNGDLVADLEAKAGEVWSSIAVMAAENRRGSLMSEHLEVGVRLGVYETISMTG